MGGGAGIGFDFTLGCGEARFTKKRGLFIPVGERPKVEKFDALGYMDGMRDVDGSMLAVTEFSFERLDPADADWWAGRARWNERLGYNFQGDIKDMVFAGYIRGKWSDTMPFDIAAEVNVEGFGLYACTVSIDIADRERYQHWYEDVFEFIGENQEEAENMEEDVRQNYGAAA